MSLPARIADPAALAAHITALASRLGQPVVIAIDGRSGAGKSTLAASLARRLDAAVIAGDDFYAGGTALRADDPARLAAACIDWTRQRPVLEALRHGRPAQWRAFDWEAFDGRLCTVPTRLQPRPIVLLEGVYAGRPELRDLVDGAVLVTLAGGAREARLLAREGALGPWERQWHAAEAHYFGHIALPCQFHWQIDGAAV